jgi:hypothetical protein
MSKVWIVLAMLIPSIGLCDMAWEFAQRWQAAQLTIPRNGLVAEWLFKTGAATNDTSGGGFHLVLTNSAAAASGILDLTTSSKAFAYTASSSPFGGQTAITFSFWAKGETTNTAWFAAIKGVNDINHRSSQILFGSGVGHETYNGDGNNYAVARHSPLDQSKKTKWTHFVCAWTATTNFYFWVDGQSVEVTSGEKVGTVPTMIRSYPLLIGNVTHSGTPDRYYDGKFARFRVYDRALVQDDVDLLYAEGKPE